MSKQRFEPAVRQHDLANATTDRLEHHCHGYGLKTEGESLRDSLPLIGRGRTPSADLRFPPTTEKSACHQPIVDTKTESAVIATALAVPSTMAWNHCPRSMGYSLNVAGEIVLG